MNNYFEKIIAPHSLSDFFSNYHEKEVLHIKRNDENYYNDILTGNEISDFLDRLDIYYPSVRMVKSGKELPSADYTLKAVPIGHHKKDGLINTEKIFALFNSGATIVIQAGQRYFDHLSKCCFQLSQKFNAPVQANLYITPDKSVGFNPHWDTHDVFVVQISGTKTWNLYGFEKELPTKNQTFVSKGYSKQPLATIQVRPGDFLYVPRGYVHDAIADDGISAHITIGILSYTWARLFNEVFPQLEEIKSFREAVPFWETGIDEKIKAKKEELKSLIDSLDFDKGLQRLQAAYVKMQPQKLNNYFSSLLKEQKINADTLFELNEGIHLSVVETDESVDVKCLGKTIHVPKTFLQAMQTINAKRKFLLADVKGNHNADDAKAIIIKLMKEGAIHIAT